MLQKLSVAVLFAVLTCGQIAFAQVLGLGKCPEVELLKKFEWADYTGVWHEYARYPAIYEAGQKCVYANYTAIDDKTVGVQNVALNILNRPVDIEGTGKILGPGRLAVVFGDTDEKDPKENYTVLGTDYKSWATVYSCRNIGLARAQFAWILTRDQKPKQETVVKALEVLDKNGISQKRLRKTKQDNCPAHEE